MNIQKMRINPYIYISFALPEVMSEERLLAFGSVFYKSWEHYDHLQIFLYLIRILIGENININFLFYSLIARLEYFSVST